MFKERSMRISPTMGLALVLLLTTAVTATGALSATAPAQKTDVVAEEKAAAAIDKSGGKLSEMRNSMARSCG